MLIFSRDNNDADVLVVVFLRGAADALNMVIPFGEDAYYHLRPTLSIPRPDDRRVPQNERVVDLDGFFGLHPALHPLTRAWEAGELAFVHACGAPDDSRSHFKAMALMERGVSDEKGPASGWISRHLASLSNGNTSPLRAIGVGKMIQRSLYGAVPASTLRSIADFHLGGDRRAVSHFQAALTALYTGLDPLSNAGRKTLDVVGALETLNPTSYQPAGDLPYPETTFGNGLKQVAMLIKTEVGLEVAAIDLGGWDTHFAQGASEGLMARLLKELGQGLSAFHADLIDRADELIVVVMSEFGRRVRENASLGTDHGHGGLMMLMGGHVTGRQVYTNWPGLEPAQLFGPGDLAATIDYRDILAEVCKKRLNNEALEEIFPAFQVTLRGFVQP